MAGRWRALRWNQATRPSSGSLLQVRPLGWSEPSRISGSLAGLLGRLRRELPPEQAAAVAQQAELRRRAAREILAGSPNALHPHAPGASDRRVTGPFQGPAICRRQRGLGRGRLLRLRRRSAGARRPWRRELLGGRSFCRSAGSGSTQPRGLRRPCRIPCAAPPSHLEWPADACVHLDPDRRAAGRRTSNSAFSHPSPETVTRIVNRSPGRGRQTGAWRSQRRTLGSHEAERQWLGSRGECRQQVAWFGKLARRPGRRSVLVVGSDGQHR